MPVSFTLNTLKYPYPVHYPYPLLALTFRIENGCTLMSLYVIKQRMKGVIPNSPTQEQLDPLFQQVGRVCLAAGIKGVAE